MFNIALLIGETFTTLRWMENIHIALLIGVSFTTLKWTEMFNIAPPSEETFITLRWTEIFHLTDGRHTNTEVSYGLCRINFLIRQGAKVYSS